MEAKPKVKLGNGKKRSSSWITAAICLTDAKAHAYTYNGKEYVNLNINVFDKPNDFGKDVAITLNDYKKEDNNNLEVNSLQDSLLKKLAESKVDLSNNLPF
jgi:hypothetical protein